MDNEKFDILGLGEIMMRLSPPDRQRLAFGDIFEKNAGGSELNVCCGASYLGLRTGIISKIPDNPLGQYVRNSIRFAGVSDDYLINDPSDKNRLGVYYYEFGAHPRKPMVIYDRSGSSFLSLDIDELPEDIFKSAKIFHCSGITLGLNEHTRKLTMNMMKRFKAAGALTSFDVNYRANLWSEETAYEAVSEILPMVDYLFVSEETSRRMLKRTGTYQDIIRGYARDYGAKLIGMTMRTATSPTVHNWDSVLYDAQNDKFYREYPYLNIEVVDRIGSGDAYLAGVLYGIISEKSFSDALSIGKAMSAVKNTVMGDMPGSRLSEIYSVIKSHKGEITSELSR